MIHFDVIHSPSETSWFTTSALIEGRTTCAFAWNEWETMSIECADGCKAVEAQIQSFWDAHFPIVHSVKTGHGYFALREDGAIVSACEPAFEDASLLAMSLVELLHGILDGNNELINSYI